MDWINFDTLVALLKKMGIGNNDINVKSPVEVFRELQKEYETTKQHQVEDDVDTHYDEMFGILKEVFGTTVKELIGYI